MTERFVYSVGTLTSEIKGLLEGGLPTIWLEGEVSNFSRPSSGHWYFNLKDSQAQIQCAMFRNANRLSSFTPENGTQITLRGRLTVYAPRGNYQIIADHVEDSGEGALRREFDQLKQRLEKAGLFAPERKRQLPNQPNRVGLVTSPTSAAVRDMIHVLQQRFPSLPIIIYPAVVQGDTAPASLIQAIATANQRRECDVLIMGRGGGSLEDLWAFNDEKLAHAIAASDIPIVSAVGHETDTTIADWVADSRAATPSAAAERVAPDSRVWQRQNQRLLSRLEQALQRQHLQLGQRLNQLERRLHNQHPHRQLAQLRSQHAQLTHRLRRNGSQLVNQQQQQLQRLTAQLQQHNPQQRLDRHLEQFQRLQQRLQQTLTHQLQQQRMRLQGAAQSLHMVSPLATLQRGYSITSRHNKVITASTELSVNDSIQVKFATGSATCSVDALEP